MLSNVIMAALLGLLPGAPPANPAGPDGQARPAVPDQELRLIPLQALLRAPASGPIGWPGSLFDSNDGPAPVLAVPGGPLWEPEWLLDMTYTVGGTEFAEKGRRLDLLGGSLLAIGRPEQLNRISGFLERVRAASVPDVEFQAAFYLMPGPAPGEPMGLLPYEQGRELLGKIESGQVGAPQLVTTGLGRAWDRHFLGRRRRLSFLMDLEVEVAQKAGIADPVVRTLILEEGLHLVAVPGLVGGMELFGLCRWQRPAEEPTHVALHLKRDLSLERLPVRTVESGFATRFDEPLALVLAPGGLQEPDLRLLLLARRLDQPPAPEPGLLLFPANPLEKTASGHQGLCSDPFGSEDEALLPGLRGIAASPGLTRQALVTALQGIQAPEPEAQNRLDVFAQPPLIAVRGSAAGLDQARRLAGFLAQDAGRRFRVELHRERRLEGEPGGRWLPLARPPVLPCLGGRMVFAVQGREETYVKDFDVEIAQSRSESNPVVATCFTGARILVCVEPAGQGCLVRLSAEEQSLLEMRRIPAESDDFGALWAPDLREVSWRQDIHMRPGATVALGAGPVRIVAGRIHETRLRLRLEEY